jgi:hypothetical protein
VRQGVCVRVCARVCEREGVLVRVCVCVRVCACVGHSPRDLPGNGGNVSRDGGCGSACFIVSVHYSLGGAKFLDGGVNLNK